VRCSAKEYRGWLVAAATSILNYVACPTNVSCMDHGCFPNILHQYEPPLSVSIMKVKIKKWNAVATWRWDIPEDDVCGICQVDFDGTCPTCKYPGDDCSLCKYSFCSKGLSHLPG